MLHRLGRGDSGEGQDRTEEGTKVCRLAAADGDVGAVGQLRIYQRLRFVGGVEDRRRDREGDRQRDEGEPSPTAPAAGSGMLPPAWPIDRSPRGGGARRTSRFDRGPTASGAR